MKGPIFGDSNHRFYYSPITSKILPVSPNTTLEQIKAEEGHFKFSYDKDEVKGIMHDRLDTLILEGTQDCNLRCSYCIYGGNYEGERAHQAYNMSKETAMKTVDYFESHSRETKPFRGISFYGGEPLLNFNLIESVVNRYKGKDNIKFTISTNGTLLDKYADFIQDNNIILAISLDGPMSVHDKYRVSKDGHGTFSKVMNNLEKLDPNFVKRNVTFSSTINDKQDLLEVYKFFSGEFAKNPMRVGFVKDSDIKEGKLAPRSDFVYLSNEYSKGIKSENLPKFLSFMFNPPMEKIFLRRGIDQKRVPVGFCIPGARKLFVKPDGKFYTCEKLGHSAYEIGNVNNGIEEEKVFSLLDRIKKISEAKCSDCWATPLCDSCIMLDSEKAEDWSESKFDEKCSLRKTAITDYLELYAKLYIEEHDKFTDIVKGGLKK